MARVWCRISFGYNRKSSGLLRCVVGFILKFVNLQLKIQDVHIRYEDSVSIPNKSVAFGITMESLSAQSCDANWQPGFSHWALGIESFKILEMQKFAIYWIDLEPSQLLSRLSLGDLAVSVV